MRRTRVRRTLQLIAATLCAIPCGLGSPAAHASSIQWEGTLTLDLGDLGVTTSTGTGVALLHFGIDERIDALRVDHGITVDQTAVPVPVTDPEVVPTVASVRIENANLGGATFVGIDAHQPFVEGQLPIGGIARFCFVVGCASSLPIDLMPSPSLGVGVGGLLTAVPATGTGPTQVQIEAGPWQIATANATQTPVNKDSPTVLTDMGFVHSPLSNTGFTSATSMQASPNASTFITSGVIQLISPSQIQVTGPAGNSDQIALFSSLTLRFVPEPGLLLLLGGGVVALALIGRSRIR